MNMQAKPPRTPAEQAIIDAFVADLGTLAGDANVTSARDRLVAEFSDAGLPSRRIESWHYTDMRTLLRAVPGVNDFGAADQLTPLLAGAAILPVIQGTAGKPDEVSGLAVEPFMDLLASGEAASLLAARGADDLVGRINSAFVSDGFSLDIADGAELDRSVEIQAVQAGGHAHTRFPVRVGAKSKATLVERQAGADGKAGFSSSITTLDVGEGAEVTYVVVQEKGGSDTHLGQIAVTLAAGARLMLFILNAGGKLVRQEIHVTTTGEGAHFDLRGINLLAHDSHTDVTLVLGHDVAHTTSKETMRNIVFDRARGVFQGQIRVAKGAQKTDAKMACNTLLLSDEAEFSAKPELEIFADDVICGHGATVADIDRNHLFYLEARGIPETKARALLVQAFVQETVEELEDAALVEALEAIIDTWLAGRA